MLDYHFRECSHVLPRPLLPLPNSRSSRKSVVGRPFPTDKLARLFLYMVVRRPRKDSSLLQGWYPLEVDETTSYAVLKLSNKFKSSPEDKASRIYFQSPNSSRFILANHAELTGFRVGIEDPDASWLHTIRTSLPRQDSSSGKARAKGISRLNLLLPYWPNAVEASRYSWI